MAPAVPAKSNSGRDVTVPVAADDGVSAASTPLSNREMPTEVQQALQALAKAQTEALKSSTYVGEKFTEQSREMHYGERDEAPIHGKASIEEAKALVDEGVPVAPLPFPVSPPDKLN